MCCKQVLRTNFRTNIVSVFALSREWIQYQYSVTAVIKNLVLWARSKICGYADGGSYANSSTKFARTIRKNKSKTISNDPNSNDQNNTLETHAKNHV